MDVPIPSALEQFVHDVISTGRYGDPAEVVAEGLRLLERRERLRQEVAAGVEQLDRGEYTEYDEGSFEQFARDIETERQERFGNKKKEQ